MKLVADFSRYTKIFLLEKKSAAMNRVKYFVTEMENKFGKCVKALRRDRGGEYLNNELGDGELCRSKGMSIQTTFKFERM